MNMNDGNYLLNAFFKKIFLFICCVCYTVFIRYSSKATWYPHACCRLEILGWRLHHAVNIRTGTRYVRACVRQIIERVHPWTLHPFWMNFLIFVVFIWWTYQYCLYMFRSMLESFVLLKGCSHAVACSIPCPIVWRAIVWCGERIWCRDWQWILHWRSNLH